MHEPFSLDAREHTSVHRSFSVLHLPTIIFLDSSREQSSGPSDQLRTRDVGAFAAPKIDIVTQPVIKPISSQCDK